MSCLLFCCRKQDSHTHSILYSHVLIYIFLSFPLSCCLITTTRIRLMENETQNYSLLPFAVCLPFRRKGHAVEHDQRHDPGFQKKVDHVHKVLHVLFVCSFFSQSNRVADCVQTLMQPAVAVDAGDSAAQSPHQMRHAADRLLRRFHFLYQPLYPHCTLRSGPVVR